MTHSNAAKEGEVETTVTISFYNSTWYILMCVPCLHLFPHQVRRPKGRDCPPILCPTQGLGPSSVSGREAELIRYLLLSE